MAGTVVFVLAAIAAVILYRQFPARFVVDPEQVRQFLKSQPTQELREYFHRNLLSGVESRGQTEFQAVSDKIRLGLAAVAGLGAIGLLLAAIGCAGILRKRRAS